MKTCILIHVLLRVFVFWSIKAYENNTWLNTHTLTHAYTYTDRKIQM